MKKNKIDLQLKLYSDILKTDYLHYGYWENPENIDYKRISLQDIRDAQVRYAEKIISLLPPPPLKVLDIGGGMGGFSAFLLSKGYASDVLTPDSAQIEYINTRYPDIKTIQSKFEDFEDSNYKEQYDILLMLESCQYINPDKGIKNAHYLLKKDGILLISDYFVYKKDENVITKSGHIFDEYIKKLQEGGFKIINRTDITDNILPTLYYLKLFSQDIILPVISFINDKFKIKNRILYFLLNKSISKAINKFQNNLQLIEPELFKKYKQYCIIKCLKT